MRYYLRQIPTAVLYFHCRKDPVRDPGLLRPEYPHRDRPQSLWKDPPRAPGLRRIPYLSRDLSDRPRRDPVRTADPHRMEGPATGMDRNPANRFPVLPHPMRPLPDQGDSETDLKNHCRPACLLSDRRRFVLPERLCRPVHSLCPCGARGSEFRYPGAPDQPAAPPTLRNVAWCHY